MYRFRDINVYVMYYVYVTSGPSLLIESTDSMIPLYNISKSGGGGLKPPKTPWCLHPWCVHLVRKRVCVYVCTHASFRTCTYMHGYVRLHICTHTHACVHVQCDICTHTLTHIHSNAHTYSLDVVSWVEKPLRSFLPVPQP